jgi:uncharacterized surface protein with fasciclin (FAS1) repeats
MKNLFKIKKVTALFLIAVLGFSCSSNDDEPTIVPEPAPKSIAEIVVEQTKANPKEFTILLKALTKAKLGDKTLATVLGESGTYTVFAPTDAAFTGAGYTLASIDIADANLLRDLLLNHVLGSVAKSTDLKTGYVKTLCSGPVPNTTLSLYVDLTATAGKVTLNGKTKVAKADIVASNGIIHIVDNVLSPLTIVEAAIANPAFKTLVTVLTSMDGDKPFGDQSKVLEALGTATAAKPFTVLAPTNSAFGTATGTGGFIVVGTTTQEQVSDVLKYHVIATGNVQSKDVKNGDPITTFLGQNLKAFVSGSIVAFQDSSVLENKGKVTTADIQCKDGIIHEIDRVLEPKFQ